MSGSCDGFIGVIFAPVHPTKWPQTLGSRSFFLLSPTWSDRPRILWYTGKHWKISCWRFWICITWLLQCAPHSSLLFIPLWPFFFFHPPHLMCWHLAWSFSFSVKVTWSDQKMKLRPSSVSSELVHLATDSLSSQQGFLKRQLCLLPFKQFPLLFC